LAVNNEKEKMNDTQTLAAPREFDENNLEAGNQTIKVQDARPTKLVRIPASGGRVQTIEVVDKEAIWSVQETELRSQAFTVTVKPRSGLVIVTDKAGKHLAKYANADQAVQKLKAAGIKILHPRQERGKSGKMLDFSKLKDGQALIDTLAPPAPEEDKKDGKAKK
jgi:hypothetical protein